MTELTLIGTRHHISESSDFVLNILEKKQPDIIFIELSERRDSRLDIRKIINTQKELTPRGRIIRTTFSVYSGFRLIQNRSLFADSEFRASKQFASDNNIEIENIDRDIIDTINRLGEMLTIDNIRELKKREIEDIPDVSMNEIDLETIKLSNKRKAKLLPNYYKAMITERNKIMVNNIEEELDDERVAVAVVGVAHVPGMKERLENKGFDVDVRMIGDVM